MAEPSNPNYIPGGDKPADKFAPVPVKDGHRTRGTEMPTKDAKLPEPPRRA